MNHGPGSGKGIKTEFAAVNKLVVLTAKLWPREHSPLALGSSRMPSVTQAVTVKLCTLTFCNTQVT